jgi:hypothetical protein
MPVFLVEDGFFVFILEVISVHLEKITSLASRWGNATEAKNLLYRCSVVDRKYFTGVG